MPGRNRHRVHPAPASSTRPSPRPSPLRPRPRAGGRPGPASRFRDCRCRRPGGCPHGPTSGPTEFGTPTRPDHPQQPVAKVVTAFDRVCIPAETRCSSVTYSRYAPSERLVRRAQPRSRCCVGLSPRTVNDTPSRQKTDLRSLQGSSSRILRTSGVDRLGGTGPLLRLSQRGSASFFKRLHCRCSWRRSTHCSR